MREIKFRLWDSDNKNFEYINFNNLELLIQSLEGFESYFSKDYFKNISKNIQQFTGLKDKNGVDIYEGDIVKETDFDLMIEKYVDSFGVVAYNNNNIGFYRKDFDSNSFYQISINVNYKGYVIDLEVIGNIHENEL